MSASWNNLTIVSGDTAAEIQKLKQQGTGDIMVHGGVQLRAVARPARPGRRVHDDDLPDLAGSGASLFADLPEPRPLELVSSTAFGNGMVGLVYSPPAGR